MIHSIKEITNNSIVFMGDTFRVNNPVQLLKEQAPEAIYIGWYWNVHDTSDLKYFIYTHENLLKFEGIEYHRKLYEQIKDKKNRCPLLLRANDSPSMIGNYERKSELDYCYMGYPYQQHLTPSSKFHGLFHAVYDQTRYLTYDQRRENYLKSTFALGFQGDDNKRVKHVSQRIYEGMAYGCVVLSESISAVEQTEGIVQYFTTKEELEEKMTYFKNNPSKIKELQEKGYDYVRRLGTNEYAIQIFRDKIKECYGIEF
jgi:spore maturation protein CgeB